jgi:GT2 family glycosyltransferase
LFFRRHLLERLGGFDERFGVGQWYGAAEETDFILRALGSGAQLVHCSAARIHHAFSSHSNTSLLASCRALRRRGRGTGGIYAKHRMNVLVILRGIAGQIIKPLLGGRWRAVIAGASVSLGLIEGFIKWQCRER